MDILGIKKNSIYVGDSGWTDVTKLNEETGIFYYKGKVLEINFLEVENYFNENKPENGNISYSSFVTKDHLDKTNMIMTVRLIKGISVK